MTGLGLVEVIGVGQVAQPAVADGDDRASLTDFGPPGLADVDGHFEGQAEQPHTADASDLHLHVCRQIAGNALGGLVAQQEPYPGRPFPYLGRRKSRSVFRLESVPLGYARLEILVESEGTQRLSPTPVEYGAPSGLALPRAVDRQPNRPARRRNLDRRAGLEVRCNLRDRMTDLPPEPLHLVEADADALVADRQVQ